MTAFLRGMIKTAELKIFQKGFNYSQDGPGNRLVYHLSGCNYKCKWCSNPEGMEQINYKTLSVDDLVKEAISCKAMFFSGGGVTLTGGEPTLQFDAILEFYKALKENNINTCIETNGTSKRLFELLPYIDHLIMDVKHFNPTVHKEWTFVENTLTLENFARICESGREALIRIPIINGFNSDPEGFVEFFKKHNTENIRFELLPYHEYGKEKWTKPYEIESGFISKETLASFNRLFSENGLKLIKT